MPEKSDLHLRNEELFARLKAGDLSAEAELLEANMGLVRSVAKRFSGRGTEIEDLIQIGCIGMVKAIRSFSPERGTLLSTYAVPLILGEIRRHFRDDGPVKVSRLYKQKALMLLRERQRIEQEYGREATVGELAQCCGMEREEAAAVLGAAGAPVSLSEFLSEDEGLTREGTIADEESLRELERVTDRIALSESMRKLPGEPRKILLLRYYRNLTQRETAERLGLTQVKVSREEKKILAFLKKELS